MVLAVIGRSAYWNQLWIFAAAHAKHRNVWLLFQLFGLLAV